MFEAQEIWRAFPKVELHVHIDCSLSYRLVRMLDDTVRLKDWRDRFVGPVQCKDLAEFLDCIEPALALMQTEDAIRLAVEDLIDQLAADNVRYAEIRFAPLLNTRLGLDPARVTEIALEAMKAASAETGVSCRMILCTLRHYTEAASLQTADLVLRFADQGVVALDLAADEAAYPIEPHVKAFAKVQAAGLNTIAHAGEAKGAESVLETLQKLKVSRIGHGVRSIEDTAAIEAVGAGGIHLEVCPSSNIQTNIFKALENHPIQSLAEAGLSVGVNTDGRTVTNVTLASEYHALSETFGWGQAAFKKTNLAALAASFAPEAVKQAVSDEINAAYQV